MERTSVFIGTSAAASIGNALAHVAAPLAVGGGVYALFRQRGTEVERWLGLHLPPPLAVGANAVRFTLGVLPDAVFAYAVGAALALLWAGSARAPKLWWAFSGFVFVVALEIAQGLHVIAGTFDVSDLVAMGFGYLLGWVMVQRRESEQCA
jgi:hypothetical protein